MLYEILTHTPAWVFALFALLLWLGATQLTGRRVGLRRTLVMPVVMIGLSLYGVLSAFKDQPLAAAAWAAAALAVGFAVAQRAAPAGTRYDPVDRSFALPGSAVPLALMMGIFFTKYVVAVQIAMHPELAHRPDFAIAIGALYGAFSGIFAARALRLWKLAIRRDTALVDPQRV